MKGNVLPNHFPLNLQAAVSMFSLREIKPFSSYQKLLTFQLAVVKALPVIFGNFTIANSEISEIYV